MAIIQFQTSYQKHFLISLKSLVIFYLWKEPEGKKNKATKNQEWAENSWRIKEEISWDAMLSKLLLEDFTHLTAEILSQFQPKTYTKFVWLFFLSQLLGFNLNIYLLCLFLYIYAKGINHINFNFFANLNFAQLTESEALIIFILMNWNMLSNNLKRLTRYCLIRILLEHGFPELYTALCKGFTNVL